MIYLFDFVFAVSYLSFRQILICAHDSNTRIYMQYRTIALWMEYTLILLFFYAAPEHKVSEAGVSFCMCTLTKFGFDYLVRKFTKHGRNNTTSTRTKDRNR